MKSFAERRGLRFISAIAAAVALGMAGLVAGSPVAAQGSTATVTIDLPGSEQVVVIGEPLHIGGWAVDAAGQGTGVNGVDVYLDGPPTAGGRLLGSASYGARRPDVASTFGRRDWLNSGFDFGWVPRNVADGPHTLYVAARTQTGPVGLGTVAVTVSSVTAERCTLWQPCLLYRTSVGWEVDVGGPGTRTDYYPFLHR